VGIFAAYVPAAMTLTEIYFNYSGYIEVGLVSSLILLYKRKFNRQEWDLIIWFAISAITMIVAYTLQANHLYNGWWYNIANFFQYGFPGYFYYKYIIDLRIKKRIVLSFSAAAVFSIIRLSIVGMTLPDKYCIIFWVFLDSMFAFIYLKQLFENIEVNPFHILPFWFCAPAMLDAMCMIPSYAIFNVSKSYTLLITLDSILQFTFSLWHFLFAFGIIYTQWLKRSALRTI
jgi:uncharacterized membrane protein